MRHPLLLAAAGALALGLVAPIGTATAAGEADDAVSWSVAPSDGTRADGRSWIELKADPGETVTEHLIVRNLGASTATFALKAADGYFTKTGRFNMLQAGQESTEAGTWIAIDETVTIAAGDDAVIPFTIAVPEAATPGDHAAGIAASITSSGTTTDGAQVGVESRVGFRVITQVTGELSPQLSVAGLAGEYTPSWNLFAPGELVIRYEATNSGNTQLAITDAVDGEQTARGDLFVGETRSVVLETRRVWPLGLISTDVRVDASVPTSDGLAAPTVQQTVTVWAVPWLHLAALAALAAFVILVIRGRRRSAAEVQRRIEEARAEGRREQALAQ